MWFVKCVSSDQTKYLEIAEKIDKTLSLKEKYKSNFSFDSKQIGLLFFQPDSKARILTMFMGVCAAIIALSLAEPTRVKALYTNKRIKLCKMLLTGPAKATRAISLFGFLNLLILTSTGFA